MRLSFLAVCAAMLLLAPMAAADWSDNFDSYDLGSGLHGQGGWEGWQGDPQWDAYVTDIHSYSAPHSAGIIPTSDIVQTFEDITTGEWEMTGWCYIPSGSTGDQYFIMLCSYWPDPNSWSVQLQFDSDAGEVSNYYTGSTTPIINDQWVEVRVEIYLDLNSYNLFYNDTFLGTSNWGAYQAIAALDLFSNGGSNIYWDDLELVQTAIALQHETWGAIKALMQ